MSRTLGAILLVLSASAGVGRSARAQGRAAVASDSLLRRIRALDSVMNAHSRSLDSMRRLLVRPVPPVEVRRGALRIRTDATLAPRVRVAVDSVAALIERRRSTTLAARVGGHVLMVARDSVRSMFGMQPIITVSADTVSRWSVLRTQTAANPSAEQLTATLTKTIEQMAMHGADSALTAWVMVGRVPLRPATADEGADAYIELATTESVALRRCRARDMASCLDVLGIDSLPGRRLDRWYAPEDYRATLRTAVPPREDSAAVAAWIRCRDAHDETGCRAAAVALPDGRVPLPLSPSARYAFLREVLDAGGSGAYDRLLVSSGSLRSRLTAAAGEPLDATVARWLDRVESSRPERMRLSPGLIVASLGWTGAILALALIRRTSWV